MNNKRYLTTGEFAKLCNINKHTLFHYNDFGIFRPKYIDENGYRYYDALQYDTFCTISQLRTVGMSLTEIKTYLEHRSPKNLIDLCYKQEDIIDMQIKQLRKIKKNLAVTRQSVKIATNSDDSIFIQHEPIEHLELSQRFSTTDDFKMTLIFGKFINSAGNNIFRNISGMIHRTEDILHGNYDKHCWFYLRTYCNKKKCDCTIKPAGKYLIAYHHGGYEILNKTYQSMLSYADDNNLILNELFYEEMVVGDWATVSSDDYILKISVQII